MFKTIKNFTIIAHIDHGKSTLADYILLLCKAIDSRETRSQILDSMELERERGITIKAQTVCLEWNDCILNFIDTPGHSDFNYEVSRALRACETSILLVDATKGVEAQTLSNLYKAMEANHFIIPVINKIDSQNANIDKTKEELLELDFKEENIFKISAKTGMGVKELLDFITLKAPSPKNKDDNLRALIIDSWYNKYFGVVALLRIIDGKLEKGAKIRIFSNNLVCNALDIGIFTPKPKQVECLSSGQIGYVVTQIKNPADLMVGDTIILDKNKIESNIEPLEGFKKSKPNVFATFYPEDSDEGPEIHKSLQKYQLNDSAFVFELENSDFYGISFRCGFLGLLHMEVVQERLLREYNAKIIPTIPYVNYRIEKISGEIINIYDPKNWPLEEKILKTYEPEALCTIVTNTDYIGPISSLCMEKRAESFNLEQKEERVIITCNIPLAEIITDFNDRLKSCTSGFASFEYEVLDSFRESKLAKLIVLINGDPIKEFGFITHENKCREIANNIVSNLKNLIDRSQSQIILQVAMNGVKNIIARETIKPYRKNVVAHCSGGDITRQKKLLEKQKKGKKKMFSISIKNIDIPIRNLRNIMNKPPK